MMEVIATTRDRFINARVSSMGFRCYSPILSSLARRCNLFSAFANSVDPVLLHDKLGLELETILSSQQLNELHSMLTAVSFDSVVCITVVISAVCVDLIVLCHD